MVNHDHSQTSADERLRDYFTNVLTSHADSLMRLALAVELDQGRAWELTKQIFSEAAKDLQQAANSRDPLIYLVKALWTKPPNKPRSGSSDIDRLYSGMTRSERLVLTACDVLGMAPVDLAEAIQMEESDIRKDLASARRSLARFQWSPH
jgi:hypothetical protein